MLRFVFTLICLFGIVNGSAVQFVNTLPSEYYVPCKEFCRGCYPGMEYCYNHQMCILKTWIILCILFIATLANTVILIFVFLGLKWKTIWIKIALGLFVFALVAFLIGTIVAGIFREKQEVPFASSDESASESAAPEMVLDPDVAEPLPASKRIPRSFLSQHLGFLYAHHYIHLINYLLITLFVHIVMIIYTFKLNLQEFEPVE